MRIKNVREIIDWRNALLQDLYSEEKKLEELSKKRFKKAQRRQTINNINEIQDYLEFFKRVTKDNSYFNSNDFADFLKKFLTLTEEEYYKTIFTINNNYREGNKQETIVKLKDSINTNIDSKSDEKNIYIISDKKTKDFIENNIKSQRDLINFIRMSKDKKNIIVLDRYNTDPFDNNIIMKPQFARHPRLKTAIYELIQLKLNNLEITDTERYEIVLKNTILRNIRRSKQKRI